MHTHQSMKSNFLQSIIYQFEYYKMLCEKAIDQVPADILFWQYHSNSNSIATIIKHLWGNMMSRWTDFLISDGEKPWRNRDAEFENDISSKEEMMALWNEGWTVTLHALKDLQDEDLLKTIYIRNQGHTVTEAIHRQLAHYAYHIGQVVYICKMTADEWNSLCIPKGASENYNLDKFSQPRHIEHYTTEWLQKGKS